MKPHDRVIDPRSLGQGVREQRLGSLTERQLRTQQERDKKFDRMNRPLVTVTLGPWFREDVPANTGVVGYRLPLPTAASTYGSTGTGTELMQVRAGRILGGAILVSADVTAGIMTLGVRVAGGSVIPFTDIQLNTTNVRSVSHIVPWAAGVCFAAGEAIKPAVITDSAFLPTTLESSVWLYVAFEAVQ